MFLNHTTHGPRLATFALAALLTGVAHAALAQPTPQIPEKDAGPSASPAATAAQAGTPTGSQGSIGAGGDTGAADADTIVVTGFRQSLRSAIDSKRVADRIVETISAEDIGKLPDNSIAESLARLPGLTTQRLDGRAQAISIRGFAPDFNTTLLNGREQVSTGDNRNVEYDQYPSEVIAKASVYKTPDASLVGQGLSGTVDLETIHPLAYGKRVFSISARGELSDNGKLNSGTDNKGYRVSGIWVDQFADNKVGVTVGVAYEDSPTQIKRFNAWGYPTLANGDYVIGGEKSYVDSSDLKRTGVNGSLEFKPDDVFTGRIDGFYSHFKEDQVLRGIEIPLYWGGGSDPNSIYSKPPYNAPVRPGPAFTQTGVTNGIANGTFTNVKGVVRNDRNIKESDLYSVGANGQWKTEGWTAILDASYSGTKRKELILESYSGTGRNQIGALDTIGVTQNAQGAIFTHQLNYSDPNLIQLTSPQGWGGDVPATATSPGFLNGDAGYYNQRRVKDDLYAFRGSLEKKIDSPLSAIQIGANYTDRKKTLSPTEFFLGLNNTPLTSTPVPAQYLLQPSNGSYLGLGPLISYDPLALIKGGVYNLVPNPNADISVKGWEVYEKITTGWVMGKIDAHFGDVQLTGNAGVQIVNADQRSVGVQTSNSPTGLVTTPFTDGANYTDVLPSLNLSLRLPSDIVLRLGAARQLIRPRLDDMKSSIEFSFSQANNTPEAIAAGGSPFSGSGGNARLRPWRANAVDVTAEKYFGKDGYIAVAGFYKDLISYIYQATLVGNFTGVDPGGGNVALTNFGPVYIWQNGQGGSIYGVEASGTIPFSLFTRRLEGVGLTGSFSYTENKILPNGPGSKPESLPGYSKYVTNVTGFFERGGFSVRGSANYRSSYTGEITGFGGGRERRLAKGEVVVDTQVGYEFKDGILKGLGILFQGQNLTDEPFQTFQPGAGAAIIDYQRFGRRFLFGANYKF